MNYIQLSNGKKMPALGLGFGMIQTRDEGLLTSVIERALELGYRHFDTAYVYENEAILGRVLKRWLDSGRVSRDQLFITSKLPKIGNDPRRVRHFLKLSLEALQVDYVDLYLIHLPMGFQYVSDTDLHPAGPDGRALLDMSTDLEALWREMEVQVTDGLVKSIGVSNFTPSQVLRMTQAGNILPANVQVELHAYFRQKELCAVCKEFNIAVTGFATLGSFRREEIVKKKGRTFNAPPLLRDPLVLGLAEKYGRTPAQILLRHMIQLQVIPVVTTCTLARLEENIKIFDFELEETDLRKLNGLDRGEKGRSFTAALFPAGTELHPEFPY